MLELKDFDCQETYDYYLVSYEKREEMGMHTDRTGAWRDGAGDRYFVNYEGIYHPYLTTEKRLLNIEILVKRLLNAK